MADWQSGLTRLVRPKPSQFLSSDIGAIGVYWGDDGGKLKFGLRCWGYLNPNYGFMEKLK